MRRWSSGARSGPDRRTAGQLRRFQLTLALSAAVGVATGLGVVAFEEVVERAFEVLEGQSVVMWAVVPGVGLVLVEILSRLMRDDDRTTTDAYVRSYHRRGGRMSLIAMGRKLVLSAVTLGSGNALGLEGPSILIGASIGSTVENRSQSRLERDDAKVLMVAGAAAGVAAVFKAPLTGVIFALEVPYRADLARRALLPTLVAAGCSYVTYALIAGTQPILFTGGSAPFDLRDLGGGLLLGLACGALARLGAWAIGHAKHFDVPAVWRLALSGGAFAVMAPIALWWFDEPLHLGPGYESIEWVTSEERAVTLLAGLFALRAIATLASVAGGGVGGLFIPLVTQGAIVGSIVQSIVDAPSRSLFPTVGIAAFLGAGYRTPLAGVAFVAEATGQPGFLVPALLAAATAQLAMGRRSFSPHQRLERLPDVQPLEDMTIGDVMTADPDTVESTATLEQALTTMRRRNRRWVPVVSGHDYVGLLAVTDLMAADPARWTTVLAGDLAHRDAAPVDVRDGAAAVLAHFRSAGREAAAVLEDGSIVGVVTRRDLSQLEVLLDRLADGRDGPETG